MRVEFHPEAGNEVLESAIYYEDRLAGLGNRFLDQIDIAAQLIVPQPEIGQAVEGDLRHFVLGQFPYTLIYRVEPDWIWIVAVAHQRQRPGYWSSRIVAP